MGKPKTQRTEALHQAARRYVVAKQAVEAIEQHNFDKLVRIGLVVWESEPGAAKRIGEIMRPGKRLNSEGGGQGKPGGGRL